MSLAATIARQSDLQLLARRFDSLGLPSKPQGQLGARIGQLGAELQRKGLAFRPHIWLSSDFFSPDGVPGIALPFYLARPRLMRLERAQTLGCEGQSGRECMRLLRHEAGHAFDTAYELHRRAEWRELFGLRSATYGRSFAADPLSRDHVRYLPHWYAQSHPAEDFAESFAVWLDPGSRWRAHYPAGLVREKLEWTSMLLGRSPATAIFLATAPSALSTGPA